MQRFIVTVFLFGFGCLGTATDSTDTLVDAMADNGTADVGAESATMAVDAASDAPESNFVEQRVDLGLLGYSIAGGGPSIEQADNGSLSFYWNASCTADGCLVDYAFDIPAHCALLGAEVAAVAENAAVHVQIHDGDVARLSTGIGGQELMLTYPFGFRASANTAIRYVSGPCVGPGACGFQVLRQTLRYRCLD